MRGASRGEGCEAYYVCLGDTVRPPFQLHLVCIYVFPYYRVCVCSCTCVCVCGMFSTHFVHLVFVCRLVCECEETTEGRPTESAPLRKDARMSLSQRA